MNRFLLFTFLFVCLIYILQASPLPQDAQQPTTDDDNLMNKAKKIFDDAKGALENTDLNDALMKTKSFLEQAGENIRKEIEKVSDRFHKNPTELNSGNTHN